MSLANALGLVPRASRNTAQVSGAHAEVCGDGVHAGALKPPCGFERETRMDTASLRGAVALGDGDLQCRGCLGHAARAGEPIEQPRTVAPQIPKFDGVPGDGGSGRAENRLVRAQAKTRHHDPLAAENQLAVHLLPRTEHVRIKSAPSHRAETNDDLSFQARHQGCRACRGRSRAGRARWRLMPRKDRPFWGPLSCEGRAALHGGLTFVHAEHQQFLRQLLPIDERTRRTKRNGY